MLILYSFIFLVFCSISFLAVLLCYCIVAVVKDNYVPSRTALKLWLLAIPLLATVLITLDFVWPDASRTYISPDGRYQLHLTIYWPVIYMDVARLQATLTDMESRETLGKISPRIREVFIVGWPDSEWADKILSVRWQADQQDIVHVVVTDMNTVYYLPSGKRVFPVPANLSPIKDEADIASETCRKREEPSGIQP